MAKPDMEIVTYFWKAYKTVGDQLNPGDRQELNWLQKITYPVLQSAIAALFAMWGPFFDTVLPYVEGFFVRIPKAINKAEDATWEVAFKWLEDAGIMNRSQAETLLRFQGLPFGVNSLFNMIVLGGMLTNYTQSISRVSTADLVHRLQAQYRPNLPQSESMIRTAFIAPEKTGEIRDILKKQGLKDEHIDLMFIAGYQLYDVMTVRELYFRKVIDKDKAVERMHEMGFTDTRITEMMQTWEIIPGPQDLLMMVAKEAFEPDMVSRYGLGEEFPEEQSEWLSKQGLSRYWQEKYWAAHWIYPSPQQVYDMMHRGLITEKDVYEYYRVIEMPTYWRDLLTKIQYNVFTRVDTRRMHQMGVLTDEELIKAYMDQGYDAEKAGKMAEFTIRYNADTDKKISQAAIVKAFRSTMIGREDASSLLQSLKYNENQADWILTQAEFDEQLELQDMYVDAAKARFLDGIWDELDARSALMKLNLPGARIDALIAKWTPARVTESKLPSKTDLDKFFKAKIIDEDTYKLEMYRLGYNYNYTDWYLKVAKK